MSDLPTDYLERLNLGEQLKLTTGQAKLSAEAAKFQHKRFLAPVLAAAAFGGLPAALGGLVAGLLPASLRCSGVH